MGGELPEEIVVAMICDKMRWTYQEYLAQPLWFVKSLWLKWVGDSDYTKRQQKHNAHGINH